MKGSGAMGPLMGPNMRQNSPSSSSEGEARGPKRTEFVILFIWKEPTESDRLRNLTSSDALAPAASANASPLHLRPKPKKDHNPPKGN